MRVIAGEMGGQRLKAVPGKNTRPTTDKIKESMFNRIGPYFDGGIGLDFYAGSGALGIEALSRGIEKIYAFENNRKAQATIRDNVETLRLTDRYELLRGDNRHGLKNLLAREKGLQFDLVLLDPPYEGQKLLEILEEFQELDCLADDAIILCELGKEDDLPEVIGQLERWQDVTMGITRLVTYRYRV
ncbi:16S rRNA (guanine(966)-N(2))-methyltransferase RsmD [Aerococcus sp. UMB7834]|nr:16S rRNA (guanine(966)-N(2))-methyltransferase RsmD [Aerococcus sp. UMB7834]MDK6804445.1 16S rRNA (guanine(966)-N(2))-methyltransferase RsmD [Aerococcus sp. UMB7834]